MYRSRHLRQRHVHGVDQRFLDVVVPQAGGPLGERSKEGLVVDGDEARLTQVVTNLLINSVRYTEIGGAITVIFVLERLLLGPAPDVIPNAYAAKE